MVAIVIERVKGERFISVALEKGVPLQWAIVAAYSLRKLSQEVVHA